ncbi:MAG: molybdopterin molybdenumtransferase MoeA, partial [Pikeienuella sp.]
LGLEAAPLPRIRARLGSPLKANGPREHYIRARLEETDQGLIAFPYPNQDSSLLSILASANALIVMPPDAPAHDKGDMVEAIRL